MDIANEPFLKALVKLGQESSASIKVLLTSRSLPHIEKILRDESVTQIIPQADKVGQDISAYVNYRIEQCVISTASKLRLHQGSCDRSDGLFLYAGLTVDDILDSHRNLPTNEKQIIDTLDNLPTGLSETYTR